MISKFIVAVAAFYHIMATAAAMMAVFHFSRVLRGEEVGHPLWRHVFNWGELHLWVSGLVLLGVAKPLAYGGLRIDHRDLHLRNRAIARSRLSLHQLSRMTR